MDQYGSCKATNHRYRVIILSQTKIKKAKNVGGGEYFEFMDFKRILDGSHCDDYLVDVIEEVIHVGKYDTWDHDASEQEDLAYDDSKEETDDDEDSNDDDVEEEVENDDQN
ncbi:calsequestrin-1-like [Capsella rubella]|uniref:calsequestrin-1-like n=1 Tax=Capsella rubella TaxID=81985 RepID=UPI000CD5AC35|nr:calsequestrin-1-like [Capsella rubella]